MKSFSISKLNWKFAASLGVAALFTLSVAQAQTNVAVGIPDGTTRNDTYGMAGYGFCAPAGGSTTVNALGYWDANGTGLLSPHVVALYGYNGSGYSLIVSATVPAGTFAPLIDGYRWVTIPTTTLPDNGQGGNYYTVQATHGGDTWTTGIGGSPVLDPFFGTYSGQCYGSPGETAGDASWSVVNGDSDGDGSTGFGGPNFGYFNPALPSLDLPILITNIQSSASGATVGDTVVFIAAFSNSPPVNLQWQFAANGVTNNINSGVVNTTNNGVVISTLTVANLQATNSGSYQVEAVNATDSSAYIYSATASLTVAALIYWNQTGTFNDNSVLALAGAVSNEVYGVDFGGSGAQTTANGYSFADYSDSGDLSLANPGASYDNYLGGGGSSGDGALDTMLTAGIYNNGGPAIPGTLNNLTVGQTYNVIALLADTRVGAGSQTPNDGFYGTDGVFVSTKQPFVFPAASPALGAYILGTFTAVSTTQPLTLVTEYSDSTAYGNSQNQVILLVETTPPILVPIYLAQDITPAPALAAVGHSVVFSAAFRNIPALNLQWQVITTNGVTNVITTGIVNVTNSNNSVVTSTLTISNLPFSLNGNSYQLKAVNATNVSDVAYSSVSQLTVEPVITWGITGTFSNNAVLALAGPSSNEVYGVDFGGSDLQVTANGYTFDDYQNTGNFSMIGSPGLYGGYMTGGATTGDGALDQLLTFGAYGSTGNTGTLNNLTVGQTYNVLALLDDTRGSAAGGSTNGFNVSDGVTTSPQQPFMFANGVPEVGGYIMGTFTATATTQTYTVENNPGNSTQYNAILLTTATAAGAMPPVLGTPRISGGDLILTGSGGTPNAGYTWLQTASLNAPIIWTTNSTGTLDGTGALSNSIPVILGQPASYFRLRMP